MKTEAIVYDFGHVRRVAYLNSDVDCVVFRSFVVQDGEIVETLREDIVTEQDVKIALSFFRDAAEQLHQADADQRLAVDPAIDEE